MAAIEGALRHFAAEGLPARVTAANVGLPMASGQHVRQSLGALLLVSERGEPALELRRLVRSQVTLKDIFSRRYPSLAAAGAEGSIGQFEVALKELAAGRPLERFRRLALAVFNMPGVRSKRKASGSAESKASVVANRHDPRAIAEQEADMYLGALDRALAKGDMQAAKKISGHLATIREEIARWAP